MGESTAVLQRLVELGADPAKGVYLQRPASEAGIAQLRTNAMALLGASVPDGYIRLLRVTNGVQIDNAMFKAAEHLVPENLDVFSPAVIVLGSAGNLEAFVYDRRDGRFHIIAMGFPDERIASFDTFDALLEAVMREQQVL